MANFDNKKTQGFAEETDMELNLDALDGVSGGTEEPSPQPQEVRIPQINPETAPADPFQILDDKNGPVLARGNGFGLMSSK